MKVIALDLWDDLRSRRLVPVAIGLVFAIVAAPVLLIGSGAEEPATPPSTSDAPTEPALAHLTDAPLGGSSKLDRFERRDPFSGGPGAGDLSAGGGFGAATAAAGGGASVAVGAAGAGLGTTSDTGTGDLASASVGDGATSSLSGDLVSGPPGGSGSGGPDRDGGRRDGDLGRGGDVDPPGDGPAPPTEPEPPVEPPPTTPPPAEPPPEEPAPEIVYRANVAFGPVEDVDVPDGERPDEVNCDSEDEITCYRPLDPGSFLPEEADGEEAILYFVGLTDGGDDGDVKQAVFVVLPETAEVDEEDCFKGACPLISLDQRDPTAFVRVLADPGAPDDPADDVFVRYRLELLGIDEDPVAE